MSSLSTVPKGDSAWLLRKAVQRVMQQVSVLETNIGTSTTGNSANTQVIFNDAGTLRGDPDLIFNTANNRLVALNLETTEALQVGTNATITGNLTVRTNKLAVTSAGVGFGTTTPAYPAHFRTTSPVIAIQDDTSAATGVGGTMNFLGFTSGTSGANIFAQIKGVKTAGSAGGEYQVFTSDSAGNSIQRYLIDSTGVSTWSVGGSTAMTLNSTGLGVGVVPNRNLDIRQDQSAATTVRIQNQSVNAAAYSELNLSASGNNWGIRSGSTAANSNRLEFVVDPSGTNLSVMRLDTAGNVGIGVTPSAWNATYNVLDIGQNGSISGRTSTNNTVDIVSNGFRNSGGTWVYKLAASSAAARYQIDGGSGSHLWYIGVAGTAGNTIAGFSTASMTLDSAGNLIWSPASSPPSLATNGQLTVNATSNTNLRFSYRGSDGVTRVANLTLA